MSQKSKWEILRAVYGRYQEALRAHKHHILDEFCHLTGWHRKYAIRVLNGPPPRPPGSRRHSRRPTYAAEALRVLVAVWKAAGCPWSVRLHALLPQWLPWARRRFRLTAAVERQLRRISARQMDRRLRPYKARYRKRLYGRTKPGALLKHHIPIRAERWRTTQAGFAEVDLVSHSGSAEAGEFLHSLNLTDIHTTWVETRAVLGKAQSRVREALEHMRAALPFPLRGIDSDNGSEFLNDQLWRYCQAHHIQFTRGRPYKKDDNAHIEQKNWTHVRKLLGYLRYDSAAAQAAMNDLYDHELRLLQNLFLPSVKLVGKVRVGSRLRRRYSSPQTPLERVLEQPEADSHQVAQLRARRDRLDPFALSEAVERKLQHIYQLAHHPRSPRLQNVARHPNGPNPTSLTGRRSPDQPRVTS